MKNSNAQLGLTVTSIHWQTQSSNWNAIENCASNVSLKYNFSQKIKIFLHLIAIAFINAMILILKIIWNRMISLLLFTKIKNSLISQHLSLLSFFVRNTINLYNWNVSRMERLFVFFVWKITLSMLMNWNHIKSHKYCWKSRRNQNNWRYFIKR